MIRKLAVTMVATDALAMAAAAFAQAQFGTAA